jgi:hypothetical protein
MIVSGADWAEKNRLTPIGRLVSFGIAAVEPGMFGLGPVHAVNQILARAGLAARIRLPVDSNGGHAAETDAGAGARSRSISSRTEASCSSRTTRSTTASIRPDGRRASA